MSLTQEDYRVNLPAYAGPLDLLLHLVKKHEIDLNNIPMTVLTEQYMQHLKLIKAIDIDLAGEFLVMAATLLEIKSAMLVPAGSEAGEDEQADDALSDVDPRYELVQQLLAYKRFKDAAGALDERREQWQARFAHLPAKGATDPADEQVEIDLEDVSVLDLCEAFARILDSIGQAREHAVTYDDTPIMLHAEDIVDRLGRDGAMTLQQIFVGRHSRSEMIGLFLATLELVRQHRVRVIQDRPGGQIRLELRTDAEQLDQLQGQSAAERWKNPDTGEIEYEWPDPEARARAERRAELRKKIAAKRCKKDDADSDDPDREYVDLDDLSDDELDDLADDVDANDAGEDDQAADPRDV